MRIGELAAAAGLSTKTLRYYEDVGVLERPPRTAGGCRDYDSSVLNRLEFVRAAQAVGLTLGEIRGIVALRDDGASPCLHVAALIEQHASAVAGRIVELQPLEKQLKGLSARARRMVPTDCSEDDICHVIQR